MYLPAKADMKKIVLNESNFCMLNEDVNVDSMRQLKICLVSQQLFRNSVKDPIYLIINSPGGSIYAGLDFIRFAKDIPNLHTVSIFAASMASAIVEALPGKRYAVEGSIMMFHRAKGAFSGQFADGEVEQRLKLWRQIVESMEITNATRIGISLKEYKDRVKDEYWVYGSDNVKLNIIDQEVKIVCDLKMNGERCPLVISL
jgi:ATP-dependent protease ClpP protease subunit